MGLRGALGLGLGQFADLPISLAVSLPLRKPHRSSAAPAVPHRSLSRKLQPEPDPLYLFYCGVRWHKSRETSAGWELVQVMRSKDRGLRALAAELLAETENGRLLVRDLRRTRSGLHQIAIASERIKESEPTTKGENMNSPYGLQIVEN